MTRFDTQLRVLFSRITDTASGRSFDDRFNESYAKAPIRKATEEQRRLWIMGQHVVRLNSHNGQMRIYGNYYYSAWLSEHAKRSVVARFGPEDLHVGVHIEDIDGSYLGFAECRQKIGFYDLTEARETARRNARIKSAQKAMAPITIEQISDDLDAIAPAAKATPESKVVSPVFGRTSQNKRPMRQTATPTKDAAVEAQQAAMILQLDARKATSATPNTRDTPEGRIADALNIIARSEAGERIGEKEAKWLIWYRDHPEFKTEMMM